MLTALGVDGKVVLDKSDVMYQLSLPDRTLDIPADPEAYRALLKQEFPDEAADIDARLESAEAGRFFSRRGSFPTQPNAFADALERLKPLPPGFVDLTLSNPTRAGWN